MFKLFTESFWNKDKVKRKEKIAKPKLEDLPLIFWRFFENSYTVDTHPKI